MLENEIINNMLADMANAIRLNYLSQKIFMEKWAELPKDFRITRTMNKELQKFLRNYGVEETPLEKQPFKITADEVIYYEYVGTPFNSDDEKKSVKMTVPGYTRNGELIILPVVEEVVKEVTE